MPLYFEETGTPGSPSIVFLHGVGASGWMWGRQIAALADFHCLNVDLPGHGKSVQIPWVSFTDTAHQVADVIQSHATDGHAHVVGLSLGGYIALVLMEHHADLVQHAVLSGVTAAPMPNRFLMKPQLAMMSLMKTRWIARMQAKALNLSPKEQTAFTENFLAMSMRTYRRIMEEAVGFYVPTALQHIHIPTLITAGGKESRIILQAVADIPDQMPNAQGTLAPGLGHGWNIEAPDLFSAMIRAWICDSPLPTQLKAADSVEASSRRIE